MNDLLTQSDIDKMSEELEYRKAELRHELLDQVKEAKAQGDLSENFEYKAAKREKNRNESRIRYLERMIKTAKIIDDDTADDEVGINSRVTIYIPEDDEEETYKIVTTVRGDVTSGRVSNVSPIGKALMKHKVGDKVSIRVNDNYSYEAIIRSIEQVGEEESDELMRF